MSYKHRAVPSQSSTSGQKLATALLAALPMMTVLGATTALSGCGFQLRGYETPMLLDVAKTAVICLLYTSPSPRD